MTAIRENALAAWDAADESERRRALDHAMQRATREYEIEIGRGQATEFRDPTLEVVDARRDPDGLLCVRIASSYRVYHYAQSGSDWSTQTIAFDTITVGRGGPLVEQRIAVEECGTTEGGADDHDDAAALREAIERFTAKYPLA